MEQGEIYIPIFPEKQTVHTHKPTLSHARWLSRPTLTPRIPTKPYTKHIYTQLI